MDLAPFAAENFNSKDWINEVFKGQDNEKRDQYASSMVMKLQHSIQEINGNLEDLSQQVLSGLPRVLRDVESLGQEASLVKTQMAALMSDVEKVTLTERNNSSLDTLVKLDTLKQRLCQSSQALKQADNWTTLATEVEEVLETNDLEVAANKVVQLQKCQSVLSNTPDSEDRAALINSYQLRIEAMASPHVVEAFTRQNLGESIKYSRILRMIALDSQVLAYYHQCTVACMVSSWKQGLDSASEASPQPTYLIDYCDKLTTFLQKQVSWVGEVFPDSDSKLILCQLAASAFNDLDPSAGEVVNASAKLQEDPIQYNIDVRLALEHFLKQAQHIIGEGSPCLTPALLSLTRSVYSPLSLQLSQYSQFEGSSLLQHLSASSLLKQEVSDSLLHLREYATDKMRMQCEEALKRCDKMSGMVAVPGLSKAVSDYVSGVLSLLSEARQRVNNMQRDINEDWTVFGTCLDLIHTAGVILVAVEDCSDLIVSSVSKHDYHWQQPPPFTLCAAMLLKEEAKENLKAYVEKITESSVSPLESSISSSCSECCACVEAALSTITSPLRTHLSFIGERGEVEEGSLLLSSAFSPQEYVTQMGQYLLTLPQHLEPLLVSPSPALNRALQQVPMEADKKLSHPAQRAVSESEVSAADFLLCRVCHTMCVMYKDAVLKIERLGEQATTQLITDIEYVINILEDLGVSSSDPLDTLLSLLKATPQNYSSVGEELQLRGVASLRMVAAVRQMRDISATS